MNDIASRTARLHRLCDCWFDDCLFHPRRGREGNPASINSANPRCIAWVNLHWEGDAEPEKDCGDAHFLQIQTPN
jgi:hypothetical protein